MDNQPKKPVAVVTGVGPGLGASLVRTGISRTRIRARWTMELEVRPFKEKF
jgi:hypothetical protein